jgi:hypothetical protein
MAKLLEGMEMNKYFQATLTGLLLASPGTSFAAGSPIGTYRLQDGPDVASEIALHADGTFQYFLMAGSLDEASKGRWTAKGKALHLVTIPKPVAAVFSAGTVARSTDAPLILHVVGQKGGGIAAVDLRVGFDAGKPVEDYTQDYGWTLSTDEKRVPRWVEFGVPIYQLRSQRFVIEVSKGNVLTFVLTPNDLGVIDFTGWQIDIQPGKLIVHRGEQLLTYEAAGR